MLHSQFPPDVFLEGATTRQTSLSRDHQGPRAVLNALERLATGYAAESVHVHQDLSIAESQLRDYQARLGKAFQHESYLSELTTLRDQLKAGLSATAHDGGNKAGPSVSDLADRIKSLKAANTIEAGPQRIQRKQASAEEPITARIRRRQEAGHELDIDGQSPVVQPVHSSSSPAAASFQERILRERAAALDHSTPPGGLTVS